MKTPLNGFCSIFPICSSYHQRIQKDIKYKPVCAFSIYLLLFYVCLLSLHHNYEESLNTSASTSLLFPFCQDSFIFVL